MKSVSWWGWMVVAWVVLAVAVPMVFGARMHVAAHHRWELHGRPERRQRPRA